jgi:hypothetical protein
MKAQTAELGICLTSIVGAYSLIGHLKIGQKTRKLWGAVGDAIWAAKCYVTHLTISLKYYLFGFESKWILNVTPDLSSGGQTTSLNVI